MPQSLMWRVQLAKEKACNKQNTERSGLPYIKQCFPEGGCKQYLVSIEAQPDNTLLFQILQKLWSEASWKFIYINATPLAAPLLPAQL